MICWCTQHDKVFVINSCELFLMLLLQQASKRDAHIVFGNYLIVHTWTTRTRPQEAATCSGVSPLFVRTFTLASLTMSSYTRFDSNTRESDLTFKTSIWFSCDAMCNEVHPLFSKRSTLASFAMSSYERCKSYIWEKGINFDNIYMIEERCYVQRRTSIIHW